MPYQFVASARLRGRPAHPAPASAMLAGGALRQRTATNAVAPHNVTPNSVHPRAPSQRHAVPAYVRNSENSITIDSLVPGGFGIGAPRPFGLRAGTQFQQKGET